MNYIKPRIIHKNLFLLSIISIFVFFVLTCLHYSHIFYGSNIMWLSWGAAVILLLISFSHFKYSSLKIQAVDLFVFLFTSILYLITHLWNFTIAPWNQNGLFDDAAWDIFFAKNHTFVTPFQPAFFDTVGYISREVVFHYYITIFFKLFGYNLLVFNVSLIILGFVTVLFTTLIVHNLFKNLFITISSALVINFFPLHYMHIFMGHRYAIAAPLMIVSLYFLYRAFSKHSFSQAIFSAFFAGLCLSSSIMGKQYILGLLLSIPFYLIFNKRNISKKDISIGLVWVIGFIFTTMPLFLYVVFNYTQYTQRENGLILDFATRYKNEGFFALQTNGKLLYDVFFAPDTYRRQFLHDYYVIPIAYYFLIIPGLFLALLKKRFEFFFLAIIPPFGAFISGAYDFRILLAVPIWVICMALTVENLLSYVPRKFNVKHIPITIGFLVLLLCIGSGLFSSVSYIWNVSKNPKYIYLLPHKDVAMSRLVQDIVSGAVKPSITMKWDEFNRRVVNTSYDTLVSPYSSYAIMHLYLQDFDDKKVLSFIDQGIQLLKTPEEIFYDNIEAIRLYRAHGKDLKLVWEISDKSGKAIDFFKKYKVYGRDLIISNVSEGEPFSIYILTIDRKNIVEFQDEIANRQLLSN